MGSVLVVDGDPDVQLVMRSALSAHRCIAVASIDEATRCLKEATSPEERPDAIVVERSLPDGDGLALIEVAEGAGVDAPILFVTEVTGRQRALEAYRAGGDLYLEKPFDIDELANTLEFLLASSPEERAQRRARMAAALVDG